MGALVATDQRPGRTTLWDDFQAGRDPTQVDAKVAAAVEMDDRCASCIGTPDDARRYLRELADVGVDQVIFIQQAGCNRHEDICSSLAMFAADVLPEFAAGRPERDAAKAQELAPYIDAALARKNWMQQLDDDDIPVVYASKQSLTPRAVG